LPAFRVDAGAAIGSSRPPGPAQRDHDLRALPGPEHAPGDGSEGL